MGRLATQPMATVVSVNEVDPHHILPQHLSLDKIFSPWLSLAQRWALPLAFHSAEGFP
jgi:hypothetical protein